MFIADYTEIFDTPDELADFMMLERGRKSEVRPLSRP